MSKKLIAQMTVEHLEYLHEQYDLNTEHKINLFQFMVKPGSEIIHQSFEKIVASNLNKALCQFDEGIEPLEVFSYLQVIHNMLKVKFYLEVRHCPDFKEFILGFSYHDVRYRENDLVDAGFELMPIHFPTYIEITDNSVGGGMDA